MTTTSPSQYLERFTQDRSPSLHTLRAYGEAFKRFSAFLDAKDIASATEQDIRAYITFLEAQGNIRATIASRLIPLKLYFKMLHESGEIPATPFARIHYTTGKEEYCARRAKVQRNLLTKADIKKLLGFNWYFLKGKDQERLKVRNKMILHILVDTGRRVVDICRILRKDCDIENLQIIFNHTKSTTGRGVSPVSLATAGLISQYIDLSADFTNPKWDAGLLIDIQEDSIRSQISEAMTEVGIKRPGLNAHAIDHFFITHALGRGITPDVISEMTGKSVKTLMSIYNHPGRDRVAEAHKMASVI